MSFFHSLGDINYTFVSYFRNIKIKQKATQQRYDNTFRDKRFSTTSEKAIEMLFSVMSSLTISGRQFQEEDGFNVITKTSV
jgi:hypothetical protein